VWLVLTLMWGIPWALMLRNPHMEFDWGVYLSAMAFVVGAPSLALYGILWAVAGFFPSSKR